jgi:hypothetical protein
MHPMLFERFLAFERIVGLSIVRAPRGSATPGSQFFAAMLSRISGTLAACKGRQMHSMPIQKLLAFERKQSQLIAAMLSRTFGTIVACDVCNLSLWRGNLIGRLFTKHRASVVNPKPALPRHNSAFNNSFCNGLQLLPPVLLANRVARGF